MPYQIIQNKTTGLYRIINKKTKKVFAKHTTKEKAMSQLRLLHSLEKKAG